MEGTGIYKHLQTYHSALVIKLEASDLLGPHRAYFQQRGVVSILIAPLLAQGELIGMLFLGTNNPAQTFNQEDLHATQAIATQIAISLRNAELFSEIQHRATQLEQIAAFGRTVASTFEHEEIYTRIAEVVPYLLPSDRVSLALYSAGKPQMHMVTMTGKADRQEFDRTAAGSSIEEVVGTEKPLLVPELQSSSYNDHQEMAQQGFNSALIAPLVVGQRILGAVIIEHKRSHRFTLTDLTLLQQVGNQIAIALENARLFGATRQRAAYEESLSEITSRLQQQSDLRDLLYQTMYDLGHTLGARRARVRLRPQVGPNGSSATQLEE
jgi:GAF domain-containing protein